MGQSESADDTGRLKSATDWSDAFIALTFILFSISLALAGCATLRPDAWNNPPLDPGSFVETDIRFFLVKEDQIPRAIKLLEATPVVELEPDLFMTLTGITETPSSSAFLVRALYYAFNPTGFRIYAQSNSVWIHHGVLSSSNSMHRYALVIFLKEKPGEVYVSCSVAG
jgi:hypothetical protein